jgi:GMP synthase PP-ATPase subunit
MAELPSEMVITINQLKQKSLDILNRATAIEFMLFENFGETDQTLPLFEELATVAGDAKDSFTRLNNLQLRVAEAQPTIPSDMLELTTQAIDRITNRIPAWQRSLEEVQLELDAP